MYLKVISLADDDLIAAIKTRQQWGAEALYDRYALLISKIIYLKVQNRTLADQLVEETFLKIWNGVDEYEAKDITLSLWVAFTARQLSQRALAVA